MKKIIISIIIVLLIGCSSDHVSDEYKIYEKYIDELKQNIEPSKITNYSINIELEKITNEETMYVLTLDNAQVDMYDIEVIVIHNQETDDIFPTSGIFEEKIDLTKENEEIKGIQLIGFIDNEIKDIGFKAMIKYIDEEGNEKKDYYIKQF